MTKPTKKTSKKANGSYDWDAAKKLATAGKLPPMPTFRSYAPHIKELHALARKKDVAGIKEWAAGFKNEKGGRVNMFRFRDLCLTALRK
jgi:hypothetical protein